MRARALVPALLVLLYAAASLAPCPTVAALLADPGGEPAPLRIEHFCPCGCENAPPGSGAVGVVQGLAPAPAVPAPPPERFALAPAEFLGAARPADPPLSVPRA